MRKLLKALFGMPEMIEAAIKTGDALVFTEEERKELFLEVHKVIGPQPVARRILAMAISVVWAITTFTGAILIVISHEQLDPFLKFYTNISLLFGGVMAFYFGAHLKRSK